jgi:hypothetical protein
VVIDPLAPRLKVRRTALVGNRVQRSDPDLIVHRHVDEANLAGVLVLVSKPDVAHMPLLGA